MSKQRNRVNLTLDDELFKLLTELSELSDRPKATIIHELLTQVKPQIERSIELFNLLKQEQIQMADLESYFYGLVADANDEIAKAIRMMNESKYDTDNGSSS